MVLTYVPRAPPLFPCFEGKPSNAWVFEPVGPNVYGPGVGSDALGGPVVTSLRNAGAPRPYGN